MKTCLESSVFKDKPSTSLKHLKIWELWGCWGSKTKGLWHVSVCVYITSSSNPTVHTNVSWHTAARRGGGRSVIQHSQDNCVELCSVLGKDPGLIIRKTVCYVSQSRSSFLGQKYTSSVWMGANSWVEAALLPVRSNNSNLTRQTSPRIVFCCVVCGLFSEQNQKMLF